MLEVELNEAIGRRTLKKQGPIQVRLSNGPHKSFDGDTTIAQTRLDRNQALGFH